MAALIRFILLLRGRILCRTSLQETRTDTHGGKACTSHTPEGAAACLSELSLHPEPLPPAMCPSLLPAPAAAASALILPCHKDTI